MISPGYNRDIVQNARAVQDRLREKYPCGNPGRVIRVTVIGGADAAYSDDTGIGVIALLSFPDLEPIGYAVSIRKVLFPYIPGFFAFRELPLYLAAYEKLGVYPDLLLVNGHGYAHPRRFGLACHVGAMLDIPTIGIASRSLCGSTAAPGPEAGSCSPVIDSGEIIGIAVRTSKGKKPIFISGGHLTDLHFALEMTIALSIGERMPRPLLAADQISKQYRDRIAGKKFPL